MVNKKLQKIWEAKLDSEGLSLWRLKELWIQHRSKPFTESLAIQDTSFDKEIGPWQTHISENGLTEEDCEKFDAIPTRTNYREIPPWIYSDEKIQKLLANLCPNLDNEKHKDRKKAAEFCLIIYYYFRLCESSQVIAEVLRVKEDNVKYRLNKIRKAAAKLGF
jgi:hypothetical protein